MNTREKIKAQVDALKLSVRIKELTNVYEMVKLQAEAYENNPAEAVEPTPVFIMNYLNEKIEELKKIAGDMDAEQ